MDEYSVKRHVDGVVFPRKGMKHVFRDTANTRDRNGQTGSRSGCSSRANLPKVAHVRSSEKGKSLRPSFKSSSSSNEAIGSSSRTTSNPAKRLIEPRKTLSSQFETDSSETRSVQNEPGFSEFITPTEEIRRGLQTEGESAESRNAILMEVGSSGAVSNTRSHRNMNQRPRVSGQELKTTGPVRRAVSSRHGLRNLSCNSISDVIPSGCSSSDSSLNRRKYTIRKGNCEGGSSSTIKGKHITGSSLEGRNSGSRNGISIYDSRRSRNNLSHQNTSVASVRTQRSISGQARGRFSSSSQGNENPVVTSESPVIVPLSPHCDDLNAPCFSYHTSMDTSLSGSSSYGRPGNISELCGVMPASPAEDDITHSLINRDSFPHYNMGSIAEVLLALERIEQDAELTHEQILMLETNLFLNGLNFYDHHREMRLDIDNMSYEELLALEERMGTVSTALPEEALAECLKRNIYQSAPLDDADESCNEDKDDIKCCICQEEYVVGDEVGGLQCEHRFHVVCIQEWLRLKNWCPICKVSAALSNSSSPH